MAKRKKNNEVTCFALYLNEKWSMDEALILFGGLGKMYYDKWIETINNGYGSLWWYCQLDETTRQKVVNRAVLYYSDIN